MADPTVVLRVRREDPDGLSGRRQFLQPPPEHCARQRGEVINEQFAFDMVVFVQDSPGRDTIGLEFKLLAISIPGTDLYMSRPDNLLINPRKRQTAFFVFDFAAGFNK